MVEKEKDSLSINLKDYLDLVDWGGKPIVASPRISPGWGQAGSPFDFDIYV